MTPTKTAIPVFVALVIIAVVAIGALLAGAEVAEFLRSLGADVAAIVVAIVLSALIVGSAIRRVGGTSGAAGLRAERKAHAYAHALGLLTSAGSQDRGGSSLDGSDWARARTEVALWGSPAVVKQLRMIAPMESRMDQKGPEYRSAVETTLRQMRQDLGQMNLALKQGELADLVLSPGQTRSANATTELQ
jgi:membrane protein implicated in regulation of membrane protease activity